MTFLREWDRSAKRKFRPLRFALCLTALMAGLFGTTNQPSRALGQEVEDVPDGAAMFAAGCLLCHGPGGRAIQLDALTRLEADSIYATLTTGVMQQQAAGLTEAERRAVTSYIVGLREQQAAPVEANFCGKDEISDHVSLGKGTWNGWSPNLRNTRFQGSEAAGLTAADIPQLRLKWAFVFPNVATAANQPTIVDGRLYIGSWDGTVYAIDAQAGCTHWTFKADSGVRVAITVADGLALFGDFLANVYAVDALTGELRWRRKVDAHPQARITGSPLASGGRLYVPVSSIEEGVAEDPAYSCCTFRGSVVALELATGKRVWKTYTIDEVPKKIGVNSAGTTRFGPSGVAVWSAPTLDVRRGLLYVATGNNYTEPDVPATDAVVAIDSRTGEKQWVHSLLPSDRWNAACLSAEGANCPPDEGPDFDFGSAPVLVHLADGSDLLLAGQKSGMLYALDPEEQGATRWEIRLGRGGSLGGVEWGMAAEASRAYVSISDWDLGSTEADGALNAVDLETGKRIWRTPNPPDTCRGRHRACSVAIAAPVTAIPGVAFVGSLDGHLRAYDTRTGRIMWDFDTNIEVVGVNGGKGYGGSVNAAGVTVANGMLYQTSGYAAFGLGMPGNVLLAFSVPEQD